MPFLKESSISSPIEQLRDEFKREGYLFIPSFFPSAHILPLRDAVVDVLNQQKWGVFENKKFLAIEPVNRINSPSFYQCIAELMKLEQLHEISAYPLLCDFFSSLLDEPIYPHPRKMIRLTYPYEMNPKDLIPPHQDIFYVKGERDTLTAWIPLGDYPPEQGGLQVAPRSHVNGLFPTKSNEEGRFGCNSIEENLKDFIWYKAHYRPGDLLVMHSLTLHRSGINQTKEFRISLDCRYSSALRTINEEQLLPPYHPHVPDWDHLSTQWQNPARFSVPSTLQIHSKVKSLDAVLKTPTKFAL